MASNSEASGEEKIAEDVQGVVKGATPKSFGKYLIEKKIGAGGMGAVFLARDIQLKRTVALKVLPRGKAKNPTLVKRFESEAQAAAHLNHENIVAVYDSGEAEGALFMVLEYVDGIDVHHLVNKLGILPVRRTLDIVKQVTRALEHAHKQDIVHRDIKPSNLLIARDGTVKLTDMGLARSINEAAESGVTRAGTTVGTVDYMAPEQACSSQSADTRSDIYSLGCTWHHMLTGRPPFSEDSIVNKLNAHATKAPPDPRNTNKNVPASVVAVIKRMMAKSPDERFQNPASLLQELESLNLNHKSTASETPLTVLDDHADYIDTETSPQLTVPNSTVTSMPPLVNRGAKNVKRPRVKTQPKTGAVIGAVIFGLIILFGWISSRFESTPTSSESPPSNDPFSHTNVDSNEQGSGQPDGEKNSATRSDNIWNKTATQVKDGRSEVPTKRKIDRNTAALDRIKVRKSSYGNDQKPSVPALVAHARDRERKYHPEWVEDPTSSHPSSTKLHLLTVGIGSPGPSHFDTLNQALQKIPKAGAIIELAGNGPFFLRPVELANRGHVVVKSSNEARPLVVLVPSQTESKNVLFRTSNGSLTLEGLHCAVIAHTYPANNELTMFAVNSGNLTVRDCSFIVHGTRPRHTTALAVGSLDTDRNLQTRVLLERVYFRGHHFAAIKIDQCTTDCLISNCLFAVRNAPVLTVTNRQKTKFVQNSGERPMRTVRFVSTTVYTNATAIEFDPGIDPNNPPVTSLVTVNSLFALNKNNKPSAAVLSLSKWPLNLLRSEGQSQFKNLQWAIPNSLFCGWGSDLLQTAQNNSLRISDAESWQLVWNKPVEEEQFTQTAWPKTQIDELSKLALNSLNSETLDAFSLKASNDGRPGCFVEALQAPTKFMLARAAGLVDRPKPPDSVIGNSPSDNVIRVDVAKVDLGKFLSKRKWSSGTTVIVTASDFKSKRSSLIEVRNKSLQLWFKRSGTMPVTVEPRVFKQRLNDQDGYNAFITVENGSLEIVNGNFSIPSTSHAALPRWFLSIRDGSFSFRNCYLQGPMIDNTSFRGWIEWTSSRQLMSKRTATGPPNFGVLVNSYLVSAGKVMKADFRRRQFFIKNCLLVSLDELFELSLIGFDSTISASFDISRSTLSATNSVFRIRSSKLSGPATVPLTFYVDETVFGPPIKLSRIARPQTTLLTCADSVRQNRQIDWWGTSNGYAFDIKYFQSPPSSSSDRPRQNFESSWCKNWEPTRIFRPLSGPDGIRLKKNQLQRSKVAASDFELDSSSRAATWAEGETAIGANVNRWKRLDSRTNHPKQSTKSRNKKRNLNRKKRLVK